MNSEEHDLRRTMKEPPADEDFLRKTVMEPLDDADEAEPPPDLFRRTLNEQDLRRTHVEPPASAPPPDLHRTHVEFSPPGPSPSEAFTAPGPPEAFPAPAPGSSPFPAAPPTAPASPTAPRSAAAAAPELPPASVYRPTLRPPTPRLYVVDDGGVDAEQVRIRCSPFRIGRSVGDLLIPHDGQMSAEHAEIACQLVRGAWKWTLTDLGSTNGTFVRVSRAMLTDGQEVILGSRLYRFSEPQVEKSSPAPLEDIRQTVSRIPSPSNANSPTLTDIDSGFCHPLASHDQSIGRDARRCSLVVDDPMLDLQDARIYRDEEGQWMVGKHKSRNGVWIRVDRVALTRTGQFQCGEQRFQVRLS